MPSPRVGWIAAAFVLAAAVFCLLAWGSMPIYPDEMAFRQQFGRIITDHGLAPGLYALCESNLKTVPAILWPVAWATSWLIGQVMPPEARLLSFAAIIGVIGATARLVSAGRNPFASLLLLASFAGVAGSGLVFVRYEFALELQILAALAAMAFAPEISIFDKLAPPFAVDSWRRASVTASVAVALFAATSFSIWAHPQGLLFLPLSGYVLFWWLRPLLGPAGSAAIVFAVCAVLAQASLALQHSSCAEFPQIELFWRKMTLDLYAGPLNAPFDWLTTKWFHYEGNFGYSTHYTSLYLPGLDFATPGLKARAILFNAPIQIVIGGTAFLALCAVVVTPIRMLATTRRNLWHGLDNAPAPAMRNQHLAFLIIAPLIVLFLYDEAQNFYRSFYINHLVSVGVALFVSSIPAERWRLAQAAIASCVAGLALVSAVANFAWFAPKLEAGYEGPSLSVSRDWRAMEREVLTLADECGADLQSGRIIVDDATLQAMMSYPSTTPVTYLSLQASIIRESLQTSLDRFQPNTALMRCSTFVLTGLKIDVRDGEMCCRLFRRP